MGEEFNARFSELADSLCDMTAEEYVNFDVETCSSLHAIKSDMVDWRVRSFKACVTEYLKKECGNLNEVVSDNDDDKDDNDDANSKDVEVVEIDRGEAITIPGRLVNLKTYQRKKETLLSP